MTTETELTLVRALERALSDDPEQRADARRTLRLYHLNPNVTECTLETFREVLIGKSSVYFRFLMPPGATGTGVRVAIESVGESQEEILHAVLAGAGITQAIIVARQGELVTVIVTQTGERARRVRVEFMGRREV